MSDTAFIILNSALFLIAFFVVAFIAVPFYELFTNRTDEIAVADQEAEKYRNISKHYENEDNELMQSFYAAQAADFESIGFRDSSNKEIGNFFLFLPAFFFWSLPVLNAIQEYKHPDIILTIALFILVTFLISVSTYLWLWKKPLLQIINNVLSFMACSWYFLGSFL